MDTSLIYGIGGVAIGMLLGWLIASLRVQQANAQHETELRLLEQALQQAQQETAARQEALQRHEQQLRQSELELRNLHSQLAAGHEKLQQLNHWRNECELLNQELRAQREVNSAQGGRAARSHYPSGRDAYGGGREAAPAYQQRTAPHHPV